jgi:stage II sporulation protein AA (anti-sigma F factor antagonist)
MTETNPLIEAEHEDGCLVLRLSGEIDLSNVESLGARIERLTADATDAVIDLTAITFIDSGGLRLLKRVTTAASGRETRLALVAPPGSIVRNVLDMTRLSDELTVRDSIPAD